MLRVAKIRVANNLCITYVFISGTNVVIFSIKSLYNNRLFLQDPPYKKTVPRHHVGGQPKHKHKIKHDKTTMQSLNKPAFAIHRPIYHIHCADLGLSAYNNIFTMYVVHITFLFFIECHLHATSVAISKRYVRCLQWWFRPSNQAHYQPYQDWPTPARCRLHDDQRFDS